MYPRSTLVSTLKNNQLEPSYIGVVITYSVDYLVFFPAFSKYIWLRSSELELL